MMMMMMYDNIININIVHVISGERKRVFKDLYARGYSFNIGFL